VVVEVDVAVEEVVVLEEAVVEDEATVTSEVVVEVVDPLDVVAEEAPETHHTVDQSLFQTDGNTICSKVLRHVMAEEILVEDDQKEVSQLESIFKSPT